MPTTLALSDVSRRSGLDLPEAAFLTALPRHRVVSFDVFDTALCRTVEHPTDVFDLVQAELAAEGHVVEGFRARRVAAEARARARASVERQTLEVRLTDIYEAFDPVMPSAVALAAVRHEREQERRVSRVNPEVHALYLAARRLGTPVIFVSDMYLPADDVRDLLAGAGYTDHAGVWVSCEHGCNKRDGALFRVAAASLGIEPSDILHVGDSIASDVRGAGSAGVSAVLYEPIRLEAAPTPDRGLSRHCAAWRDQVLSGALPDERSAAGLVARLGYSFGAPLLLGFVGWVATQVREAGDEHVHFCARDGWLLLDLYERLRLTDPALPPASYLLVSRRALCFPAIESLDDDLATYYLRSGAERATVGEYFGRIGLPWSPTLDRAARGVGFTGPDDVVVTADDHERLERLFAREGATILAAARVERERLHTYLRANGLLNGGQVALVDIGWHANSQRALVRCLASAGASTQIAGYYLGLFTLAERNLAAGIQARALLCQPNAPLAEQAVLQGAVQMLEVLLQAPHPSVVGFDEVGGRLTPRFAVNEDEERQRTLVRRFQDAAVRGAEDWLRRERVPPPEATVRAALRSLLIEPDTRAADLLGDLRHFDGVNHHGPARRLADIDAVTSGARTPLQGFAYAFWKGGFLGRLRGHLDALPAKSLVEAQALLQGVSSDPRVDWEHAIDGIVSRAADAGVREAAIYGAGEFGTRLFRAATTAGMMVPCLVDSSAALHGTSVLDREVLSVDAALARGHRAFLVGSAASAAPIAARILAAARAAGAVVSVWSVPVPGLRDGCSAAED